MSDELAKRRDELEQQRSKGELRPLVDGHEQKKQFLGSGQWMDADADGAWAYCGNFLMTVIKKDDGSFRAQFTSRRSSGEFDMFNNPCSYATIDEAKHGAVLLMRAVFEEMGRVLGTLDAAHVDAPDGALVP